MPRSKPQKKDLLPETARYKRIVDQIKTLYGDDITDQEAHEAARNFIGFMKTVLEICNDQRHK